MALETSRTATPVGSASQTSTEPLVVPPTIRAPDGTLQLRGGPVTNRRVQWDEDVVDNEGLGRKSSKGASLFGPTHSSYIQPPLLWLVVE